MKAMPFQTNQTPKNEFIQMIHDLKIKQISMRMVG